MRFWVGGAFALIAAVLVGILLQHTDIRASVEIAPVAGSPVASPAASPLPSETGLVQILQFVYEPSRLEVRTGETVRWVNLDGTQHTVKFDDHPDSGGLSKGETFERTFGESGTYFYECFYHQNMTGFVIVS